MTDFKTIQFKVSNQVATLTLDNPSKRNALDTTMRVEVSEVVMQIRRDPSIRALILTGANGHFCAGGDLKNIATVGLDNQGWRQRLQDLHVWLQELLTLDRPVIAAVDGAAAGAGFSEHFHIVVRALFKPLELKQFVLFFKFFQAGFKLGFNILYRRFKFGPRDNKMAGRIYKSPLFFGEYLAGKRLELPYPLNFVAVEFHSYGGFKISGKYFYRVPPNPEFAAGKLDVVSFVVDTHQPRKYIMQGNCAPFH